MDAGLSILQRTAEGDHPGKFGFRQVIRAGCAMTTIDDPRGQVLRIRQTAISSGRTCSARARRMRWSITFYITR